MPRDERTPKYDVKQISRGRSNFSLIDQKSIQPLIWDATANNVVAHMTFSRDSNDVMKYILGNMTSGFEKSTMQSVILGDSDPFNDEFYITDYTFSLMLEDDPFIYLLLVSKSTGKVKLKLNFDFFGRKPERQSYVLELSPNERLDLFIPVKIEL